MKKMLLLLFVFVVISTSAHAALIQVKLTVASSQGIGNIMVFNKTANTPGVNCSGTTPCNFTFKSGTSVAITANSSSVGFALRGWRPTAGSATACASQLGATCTFTITQDSSATAKFDETFGVRVQVGNGTGTIHVTDQTGAFPIDCTNVAPLSCSRPFFKGSIMTIKNNAGPNQQFSSYATHTGSASQCTGNPCIFTLAADTAIVTNFIQIP